VRYIGKLYRPPSEANSYILQATIGCSWNKCVYCDMYSDKSKFRVRPLADSIADIQMAAERFGDQIEKVFVADGDALIMDLDHWAPILAECRRRFPRLRQISSYAMATNVLDKSDTDLARLAELGLSLLYMGPESGDDRVLKRIAKGSTAAEHIEAARRAHQAGMKLSAIFLLGAGGVDRSNEHARASAELATAMDPEFLAALTLTVVPGTTLAKRCERGRFELPDIHGLLTELRTFVFHTRPSDALFRTNHASNYLPLSGRLPSDRKRITEVLDAAISGMVPLRPEWTRAL